MGSTGDNKSLVNFHLEPHALYQLEIAGPEQRATGARDALRRPEQDLYRKQPAADRQMSEPDKDAEIERLKQLLEKLFLRLPG